MQMSPRVRIGPFSCIILVLCGNGLSSFRAGSNLTLYFYENSSNIANLFKRFYRNPFHLYRLQKEYLKNLLFVTQIKNYDFEKTSSKIKLF